MGGESDGDWSVKNKYEMTSRTGRPHLGCIGLEDGVTRSHCKEIWLRKRWRAE